MNFKLLKKGYKTGEEKHKLGLGGLPDSNDPIIKDLIMVDTNKWSTYEDIEFLTKMICEALQVPREYLTR